MQAELFTTSVNLSHSALFQMNYLHLKRSRKAGGRTARGAFRGLEFHGQFFPLQMPFNYFQLSRKVVYISA